MNRRSIHPAEGPVKETFRAVPSKSVTHRALIAAALASGPSTILDPLIADDTRTTADGLEALGFTVRRGAARWDVDGRGGRVPGGGTVRLAESGTSLRLLTAVAALGERPTRLDGSRRLRQRPVRELAGALTDLGARLRLAPAGGGLPLEAGGAAVGGGRVQVPARRSSQFASALLLIGSRLPGGLHVSLIPPAVSLPYVRLTARVLAQFGVVVERTAELTWKVAEGEYPGREYRVEGDHSSASYFLAAAAVLGGRVRVEGLDPESAQPDARLGTVLAELGCAVDSGDGWVEVEGTGRIPSFDLDLSDAPDLVPTVAVLALFSDGPAVMRGIAHLRLKESDRLAVLARNLRRVGREASATGDALRVSSPSSSGLRGAEIATDSDHRMAMAFAVAGLRVPGLAIDDAECVSKSNPGFWRDLSKLEGGQ